MSNVIELEIIDPTCVSIKQGCEIAKDCLSYPCEFWRSGPRGKTKQTYQKSFVFGDKKTGFWCYAGFIDKIKTYCEKRNIPFSLTGELERITPVREPVLPGIEFRPIQLEAIKAVHENQCGVIALATGIGKTIFLAGLLSTYENPSLLFLCRTNDLAHQSYEVFKKFGFNPCKIGDGNKAITSNVVIATAQSFKSLNLIELSQSFSCICVDEAHKGMSPGSEYEKILSHILAPIRIALTATVPEKKPNALLLEGLIGKTIINADTSYGVLEGHLAKPTVEFLVVPELKKLKDFKSYRDIYRYGIVENVARHNVICSAVEKEIKENRSVLIFCVEIEHIQQLSDIMNKKGISHEVVFGNVSSEERLRIKNEMNEKKNLVTISSVIWAEGLDIASLDCIVNAAGGKSSEVVIQKAGRALRITEDKKTATIYEVLDQGKYLAEHTIRRIVTLKNLGFL